MITDGEYITASVRKLAKLFSNLNYTCYALASATKSTTH